MNVRFACPGCSQPAFAAITDPRDWQCAACDHLLRLPAVPADVATCPICGNNEIYKKKDFPHWLGLTILTAASLAFIVAQNYYYPKTAWMILIGSALFDGGLYVWVGDVLVCYGCGAHIRGVQAAAGHAPFDLGIAERYRQERIRRDQLQQEPKP